MDVVTISSKYQIVIPKEVREKFQPQTRPKISLYSFQGHTAGGGGSIDRRGPGHVERNEY